MLREIRLKKKINSTSPFGSAGYTAETNHGEHIYFGKLRPSHTFGDISRVYPLGGLLELGSYGSLTFKQEPKFDNSLDLKGNTKKIEFMTKNSGIIISGLRAFRHGVANALIRKLHLIAIKRHAKYIYLETNNSRMENVAKNLGFVFVGTDIAENKVYLKIL